MSYNSKYTGAEVESFLDQIAVIDTEMSDTSINAVQNKVIKSYVDEAIASAIILTINASY